MSRKIICFPKKPKTNARSHTYRCTHGAVYSGDEALSRKTDKDLNLDWNSLDRSSWELKYPATSASSLATEIKEGRRWNFYFLAICLKEGNFPYFFKGNPEETLAFPPTLSPQKGCYFRPRWSFRFPNGYFQWPFVHACFWTPLLYSHTKS